MNLPEVGRAPSSLCSIKTVKTARCRRPALLSALESFFSISGGNSTEVFALLIAATPKLPRRNPQRRRQLADSAGLCAGLLVFEPYDGMPMDTGHLGKFAC